MRSSSISRSLILVASAALTFGACGEPQTNPGGSGMTTNPTGPAAGTPASANAGTPGAAPATAGTTGMTATGNTGGSAAKPGGAAGGTAAVSAGAGATPAAAGTTGGAAAGSSAAAGGGAAGAAAGGGAATFTRVHAEILTGTGCAVGACHGSAMAPSKLGLADKAGAYKELVGIKAMGSSGPAAMMASGCAGMPIDRVKAGDPAMSLLMQKLEKTHTCGQEMPPGGMLKPEQLKLVKDWIMAGAKDD